MPECEWAACEEVRSTCVCMHEVNGVSVCVCACVCVCGVPRLVVVFSKAVPPSAVNMVRIHSLTSERLMRVASSGASVDTSFASAHCSRVHT